MNKIATIAGLAVAATAMTASAGVVYSADIDVAHDGSAGEAASLQFSMGALDSIDSICIDLSATWGGDFIITLVSDAGASFTLMDRETTGSGFGNNFEMGLVGTGGLDDVDTYEFFEMGQADFTTSGLNAGGAYNADSWTAGPIAAANWTLTVSDNAGGDTMAIGGFSIKGTVPTPGSLALLGFGGLVAGRRRR